MDQSSLMQDYGALRGGSNAGTQWFPDPFLDYSGLYTPRNLRSMLRWCEMMWAHNGTYRMGLQRVVAYFLTKVELSEVTDSVKKKYEEFLNDTLKVMSQLRMVGLDFIFYGNSFTSLYVPFRRYLRCQKCKFEQPIDRVLYTFRNFKFYAQCARCNHRGEHDVADRRSMEQDKLRVIRWSPHQMQILFHPLSHDCQYLYTMPADFKRMIKEGKPFYLQYTPWEMVEAIQQDCQFFAFNDNVIFHLKEETLAGLQNRGWGIPLALSNFKQGFYIQVLKRYNEALALDYIVPWRVLTPGKSSENVDPMLRANMGDFVSRIRGMIGEHRRDPLAMHHLPFPVDYHVLGGEANQLAPHELLTTGLDELLNSCGVPAELYKGTLQLQAMPTALRLFEATWPHLVAGFNNWLNWLLETVAATFNWDHARAKMKSVTLADDIEARMIRLQLAASQKISDSTALSPLGIDDIRAEIRKIFDEKRIFEEESKKFQQEQEQAMEMQRRLNEASMMRQGMMPGGQPLPGGPMAGGMPPGGGPGGGMGAPGTGQGGSVTPGDLLDQADQIAQQLIGMPEGARRRQLSQLRQSDETLHAVVKQRLSNMRSEARSVGQDQMIAQMAGQPPPPM